VRYVLLLLLSGLAKITLDAKSKICEEAFPFSISTFYHVVPEMYNKIKWEDSNHEALWRQSTPDPFCRYFIQQIPTNQKMQKILPLEKHQLSHFPDIISIIQELIRINETPLDQQVGEHLDKFLVTNYRKICKT
jgi:hypothetical protein